MAPPEAEIDLIASQDPIEPSDEVGFTVRLSAPDVVVGGLYVDTIGVGELRVVEGGGLVDAEGKLTHFEPRVAEDGVVSFEFSWLAPSEAGNVRIAIHGLAANGDGTSAGDVAGYAEFDYVFGCEGQYFYYDGDGDGYGSDSTEPLLACAGTPPEFYAAIAGDCSDTRASVNPDGVETCNQRDDDCDGEVDEDLEQAELWSDADGDGYYNEDTDMLVVGCTLDQSYATEPGDCAPDNEEVHPGARETCNMLDDDCNGEVDDGQPCGDGAACVSGQCVDVPSAATDDSTGGSVGAAGTAPAQEPSMPVAPSTPGVPLTPADSGTSGDSPTTVQPSNGCGYSRSRRGHAAVIVIALLALGVRLGRHRR